MGRTKAKLQNGQPALGGWIMIGHPSVAEILAGEGFDWLAVDMEHTSTTVRMFHELSLAVKATAVDLLVRLPGHDPQITKLLLDSGADGISQFSHHHLLRYARLLGKKYALAFYQSVIAMMTRTRLRGRSA